MSERPDLGAMLDRLLRDVLERERRIFEAEGLDMWDYTVLIRLLDNEVTSQAELARLTRRDQTRLIRHLDRLEELGLIARAADPADRRSNRVSLTRSGRATAQRCRRAVRSMEESLLAELPASTRRPFLSALERLTEHHVDPAS